METLRIAAYVFAAGLAPVLVLAVVMFYGVRPRRRKAATIATICTIVPPSPTVPADNVRQRARDSA